MADSANIIQACACGGTIVITPARPGAEPKAQHRDAKGSTGPCPSGN